MTPEAAKVAITGANGYVGGCLAGRLRAGGMAVRALVRRPGDPEARAYALGEALAPGALAGCDVLVHCAYDFAAARWEEIRRANVEGSLRLFDAAREAGVGRILFISTLSAFPGCISLYGRAKLAVEQEAGDSVIVVRPGLVHDARGPGGVVGALGRLAGRLPVVPMVGAGDQVLHACHSDDLTGLIERLCRGAPAPAAPVSAACPTGWKFIDILKAMAAAKGRHPRFVPVPPRLLLAGLRALEATGYRSRLRSDSLVSLMNQNPAIDFSGAAALGIAFRDFAF